MLLDRVLRRERRRGAARGLASDARAMRAALDALHAETNDRALDVQRLLAEILQGEVAAPTSDVIALRQHEVDPDDFYVREVRPSWEGLNEAQRAARIDGLMELCSLLETADAAGMSQEMGPTVRTKTLLLAWAFDATYGYVRMLERGELP